MSKKLFTKHEIKVLSQNKYIKNISEKAITYTSEFRRLFIAENLNGKSSRAIFEACGFDIDIIGMGRIDSSGCRLRRAYNKNGVLGLDDTRKGNSGRPLERDLTLEKKFSRSEARIKYLEAEIELLKKLDAHERRRLGRECVLSASEKYILIEEIISKNNLINMVVFLCTVA